MIASAALIAIFAAAAAAAGHALAAHWRAPWFILPYALLIAAAERFFLYALFSGPLLSVKGYALAAIALTAAAALAYRATQARRMVRQYPWLYEPAGWLSLSWRPRQ
ncbi:MAG: DUF6867 family protein [Stellaceae bacterium]